LREETGLVVDPAELTLAGVVNGARGVAASNGFLTVFLVSHAWSGEPVNAEPHKHSQVAWCPVGQLPEGFAPASCTALVNHLRGGRMMATRGF